MTDQAATPPDYECKNCIGMDEHGCYCKAVGATAPGWPTRGVTYPGPVALIDRTGRWHMSLNGLNCGGQFKSDPPSLGEKVFFVVLIAAGIIGYITWLIVGAFI